jgi:hypothetical protein
MVGKMATQKRGKRKTEILFEIGKNLEIWNEPRYAEKWILMLKVFKGHWLVGESTMLVSKNYSMIKEVGCE